MNTHIAIGAVVAIVLGGVLLPGAAHADAAAAPATEATAARPWEKADDVVKATEADLQTGGLLAVAGHVPDLERALADASQSFAAADTGTGTIYVLVDGPTEALVVLAQAASDKNTAAAGRQVVAVRNPYPLVSLYLGSYYNEIGKPEEALRVLDAGLTLSAAHSLELGQHRPLLISERGAALMSLKRWPDALADYDQGLAIKGLEGRDRARLYRGRGFTLTELGRLDEAEQAYRESLKLDPDNTIAQGELEYIAHLRVGGTKEPGGITLPKTQ